MACVGLTTPAIPTAEQPPADIENGVTASAHKRNDRLRSLLDDDTMKAIKDYFLMEGRGKRPHLHIDDSTNKIFFHLYLLREDDGVTWDTVFGNCLQDVTTGQVGDSEIAVDDVTKAEEESAMSCLFVVDKKGDVNQADVADVEMTDETSLLIDIDSGENGTEHLKHVPSDMFVLDKKCASLPAGFIDDQQSDQEKKNNNRKRKRESLNNTQEDLDYFIIPDRQNDSYSSPSKKKIKTSPQKPLKNDQTIYKYTSENTIIAISNNDNDGDDNDDDNDNPLGLDINDFKAVTDFEANDEAGCEEISKEMAPTQQASDNLEVFVELDGSESSNEVSCVGQLDYSTEECALATTLGDESEETFSCKDVIGSDSKIAVPYSDANANVKMSEETGQLKQREANKLVISDPVTSYFSQKPVTIDDIQIYEATGPFEHDTSNIKSSAMSQQSKTSPSPKKRDASGGNKTAMASASGNDSVEKPSLWGRTSRSKDDDKQHGFLGKESEDENSSTNNSPTRVKKRVHKEKSKLFSENEVTHVDEITHIDDDSGEDCVISFKGVDMPTTKSPQSPQIKDSPGRNSMTVMNVTSADRSLRQRKTCKESDGEKMENVAKDRLSSEDTFTKLNFHSKMKKSAMHDTKDVNDVGIAFQDDVMGSPAVERVISRKLSSIRRSMSNSQAGISPCTETPPRKSSRLQAKPGGRGVLSPADKNVSHSATLLQEWLKTVPQKTPQVGWSSQSEIEQPNITADANEITPRKLQCISESAKRGSVSSSDVETDKKNDSGLKELLKSSPKKSLHEKIGTHPETTNNTSNIVSISASPKSQRALRNMDVRNPNVQNQEQQDETPLKNSPVSTSGKTESSGKTGAEVFPTTYSGTSKRQRSLGRASSLANAQSPRGKSLSVADSPVLDSLNKEHSDDGSKSYNLRTPKKSDKQNSIENFFSPVVKSPQTPLTSSSNQSVVKIIEDTSDKTTQSPKRQTRTPSSVSKSSDVTVNKSSPIKSKSSGERRRSLRSTKQ